MKGFPPPAPLVFTPLKNQAGPQTTLSIVKKPVEEKAAAEKAEMTAEKCWNCDKVFTPDHQCEVVAADLKSSASAIVNKVEELPPPLPLCLYCCHRGSGKTHVHYFMQCVCSDRVCTCWCYCTEAQLEHKKLVYPGGFGRPGYPVKTVKSVDRPKAKDLAEARTFRLSNKPCENPSCLRDFEEDNARALGQL